MTVSNIDIIIPSYRLNDGFLLPILRLKKPDNCILNYIVVADNPNLVIPKSLNKFVEEGTLKIIKNHENLGAHESRNKGIAQGKSEWILFLDDDIIPNNDLLLHYVTAINKSVNPVPGFVGITRRPKPMNTLTEGVLASDILTFFTLPEIYNEMSWGVTANLMINRNAIGAFRFSNLFPKAGGGEDIDLCLNIVSHAGHKFKTLPEAVVNHPWWDKRGTAYKRFFTWAFGDSLLLQRFPEFRYYNFPNVVESLCIGITIGTSLNFFSNINGVFIPILLGILIGESVGEWTKLFFTKKIKSPVIVIESALVRASNDLGRLVGNLSRRKLSGFFERFDYFCDGGHIKNERKWAFVKFTFYLLFILMFYQILSF